MKKFLSDVKRSSRKKRSTLMTSQICGGVQETLGKARRKVGDAVKDLGNIVRK